MLGIVLGIEIEISLNLIKPEYPKHPTSIPNRTLKLPKGVNHASQATF
jgi:hypothetical protein